MEAGRKGLPWVIARLGFDGYQSLKDGKFTKEGVSTTNAQRIGWERGYISWIINSFL